MSPSPSKSNSFIISSNLSFYNKFLLACFSNANCISFKFKTPSEFLSNYLKTSFKIKVSDISALNPIKIDIIIFLNLFDFEKLIMF